MAKQPIKTKHAGSRFIRSVNIEHDLWANESLSGYVVTAGVRRALSRIAPARHDNTSNRAWTLTGPYGTGKSAFALFVAQLFAHGNLKTTTAARRMLRSNDKQLAAQVLPRRRAESDLLPIVVTGSREPLSLALVRGLGRSLQLMKGRKTAALARKVDEQQTEILSGRHPSVRKLTELFAKTLDSLCNGKDAPCGIFLIVDELGKLLEHASTHSSHSDVFLFQALAEFASRTSKPFLILGILHQDFSTYAEHLPARERSEWDKVRGRFEDIAFEEPADEILRLIAQARVQSQNGQGSLPARSREAFNSLCETAWTLDLAPPGVTKREFVSLLNDCWPLHPLVSVLLGQLFRKLAQNERSVFSFLESSEPNSLHDHIRAQRSNESSLYSIDRLYDYLVSSIGDGLYIHMQGKRWAEIETVLARLPDASHLDNALVKSIGLLGAMGQWRHLRATKDVLRLVLAPTANAKSITNALRGLQKQSAIVDRKYNKSFALWEGSDVDLEQQIRLARDRIDRKEMPPGIASYVASVAT